MDGGETVCAVEVESIVSRVMIHCLLGIGVWYAGCLMTSIAIYYSTSLIITTFLSYSEVLSKCSSRLECRTTNLWLAGSLTRRSMIDT